MKKIFTLSCLIALSSSNIFAASSDSIGLELARSKKMQDVITRLNKLYDYSNSYILSSTTKNIDLSKENLQKKFSLPAILFQGYDKNITLSYDAHDKNIVFSDAVPNKLSDKMIKEIKNSTILSPRARFDQSSKKFFYIISPEAKAHIEKLSSINIPTNPNQTDLDIPSVVDTKADLEKLTAPIGTIVYLKKDANSEAVAYVKTKDSWAKVASTSGANHLQTAPTCDQTHIGAIRISKEKGCTQYCSKNGGTPTWTCIGENSKVQKNANYRTCYEIKQANPSAQDGVYTIDPDGPGGDAPYEVYCDMKIDGGGWTAIKYTYDTKSNPIEASSHQPKNYYLSQERVKKLLEVSSTFLFQEDKSHTLAKLKPKAYQYIKQNIENNHGWFADTYKEDNIDKWMDKVYSQHLPYVKHFKCDNFRDASGLKTGKYMYTKVLDSCGFSGFGSILSLNTHDSMEGDSIAKNYIYIGGPKADPQVSKIPTPKLVDSKEYVNKVTKYSCPNGYTLSGTSCIGKRPFDNFRADIKKVCPSGYTESGYRCVRDIKVYSCPTGYEYRYGKCIIK